MLTATFKDKDNREYKVSIYYTNGISIAQRELIIAEDGVIITQNSDGLFAEIKPLTCSVTILTDEIIPILYSTNPTELTLNVTRTTDNVLIFEGYVTPYIYNQPYANSYDALTIEAVSKISAIKDMDYTTVGDKPQILPFHSIIRHILEDGAKYTNFEVRYSNSYQNEDDRDLRLSEMSISEANFFDDDEERTPWKMEEVLKEILRYLGLTLVEYEGIIYLLDYQDIAKRNTSQFCYFDNGNNWLDATTTISSNLYKTSITKDDYASDDSSISYDDIYNKFTIDANTYNIEALCPKVEELTNSRNLSAYPNETTWTRTTYKWNGKVKSKNTTWYEYQTLRLLKNTTGWKHRYFRMEDGTELSNYFDSSSTSVYNKTISPRANTRCAMIQKYAFRDADDPTPAKLDWSNFITFFCLDDTTHAPGATDTSKFKVSAIPEILEQPVLEYTSSDPIRYSPGTGTSLITIKGDLFYQCNSSGDPNLNIVNTSSKYYTFSPVDNVSQTEAYRYKISESWKSSGFLSWGKTTVTRTFPSRKKDSSNYGRGWPMLKCRLQIGDKFWNGTFWTTATSDFYINYNNSPKDGEEETFKVLSWQSIAPNYDYTSKIDEDNCWAIPIKPSDNVSGVLKFTLYTPSQLKPLFDGWNYATSWMVLFPVIFMRGFEINYVYTDTGVWFLNDEREEADITYTNSVDTSYDREGEDVECKINTYLDNVPISRSFVLYNNSKFLGKIYNKAIYRYLIPEYQLIQKKLNHYLNKKLIYETTLYNVRENGTDSVLPYTQTEFIFNQEDISTFENDYGITKKFILDTYERNLVKNTIKCKFIEW